MSDQRVSIAPGAFTLISTGLTAFVWLRGAGLRFWHSDDISERINLTFLQAHCQRQGCIVGAAKRIGIEWEARKRMTEIRIGAHRGFQLCAQRLDLVILDAFDAIELRGSEFAKVMCHVDLVLRSSGQDIGLLAHARLGGLKTEYDASRTSGAPRIASPVP